MILNLVEEITNILVHLKVVYLFQEISFFSSHVVIICFEGSFYHLFSTFLWDVQKDFLRDLGECAVVITLNTCCPYAIV